MISLEELILRKREILDEQLSRLAAEESLHEFVKQAWHVTEPKTKFVDGWHIRAICEHLEAVTRGDIKSLIINVPPRTCKSTIVSVMWPAWMWVNDPHRRLLCAANSHSLSFRDSLKCRDLIDSEWYQRRWGDKVKILRYGAEKFENSKFGYRQATSVGSKIVGKGGDILIADDLNDTTEALSDLIRGNTNRWYSTSFSNRLDDIKTGGIVIIMQRCHEEDVTGYILSSPQAKYYVHLMLPMRFEAKRKCVTVALPGTDGKPWEDPRKNDGDLLWPARFGEEECKLREINYNSAYSVAGQEQQRPAPEEGGLIKANWFQKWKKPKPPEKFHFIIQSWDTALEESEMSDYSVCTTWGIFDNDEGIKNMLLLGLYQARLGAPDLRDRAKRLYADYRDNTDIKIIPDGKHIPDMVLIEKKGSGHGLLQEMRRAGIKAYEYIPDKDKIYKVNLASFYIKSGIIYLPYEEPNYTEPLGAAKKLLDECIAFPNGAHDDIVDSMVQAILRVKDSGLLRITGDPKLHQERKRQIDLYGPGEN